MTIANNKKLILKYYDDVCPFYISSYEQIIPKVDYINKVFSYIHKINPKVIEIGSGSGRDAPIIVQHTSNYVGIDLSSEMVNLSRKMEPGINFILGDVESYNFPDHIDVVFAFASLLHFNKTHLRKLLFRIFDNLNPGGIIALTFKEEFYHFEINKFKNQRIKTYYYSVIDIQRMLSNKIKILYKDTQFFSNEKWFCLMIQK